MRRILYFVLCIVFIFGTTACRKDYMPAAIKSPEYPKSISSEDIEGQLAVRDKNPLHDNYIQSLHDFLCKTSSSILKDQSGNLCYSPISLYMALSMAGVGAQGVTQDEIISTLGLKGMGTDFISTHNRHLFNLLHTDNEMGKLKIANSLWLKKGITFKDAYINQIASDFYASVYDVDFSDERTSAVIGRWVSENTNGVLSPKIDLNSEQIMSIINTIYLRDEWINKFEKDETKPDVFHLENGTEVKCDFMNKTYDAYSFEKGDGFTKSSFGLKNSGSMVFILPDKGIRLNDLISTPDKISLLFKEQKDESGKVIFKIPKFSFESDLKLGDTLMRLGIKSAFHAGANFKGITNDPAFISDIIQQTNIAIDEKGVEAAAFTEIMYTGSSGQNSNTVVEMILDRPFIFAIQSTQGAILFVGIVHNPREP